MCAHCLSDPPRHDGIAAGTLYNAASRKLVLAFKHGRRIAMAPMLARLIASRLPQLGGDWLIVPVPLHRWRLWQRGVQSGRIAGRRIGGIDRGYIAAGWVGPQQGNAVTWRAG
jgi:predicted amidophosphoribosyltransferase